MTDGLKNDAAAAQRMHWRMCTLVYISVYDSAATVWFSACVSETNGVFASRPYCIHWCKTYDINLFAYMLHAPLPQPDRNTSADTGKHSNVSCKCLGPRV